MSRLQLLLDELKRRRVFRVAAAYAVVAFVIWQAADFVFPALKVPDWVASWDSRSRWRWRGRWTRTERYFVPANLVVSVRNPLRAQHGYTPKSITRLMWLAKSPVGMEAALSNWLSHRAGRGRR
jgi:hypothetical protein